MSRNWPNCRFVFWEGVVSSRLYRFGRFELGHGPLEGHLFPVRGHRGAVNVRIRLADEMAPHEGVVLSGSVASTVETLSVAQ